MAVLKVYEKASAKINLSLDVHRKRADGYHEVEMVMTMVDLADRLELEPLPAESGVLLSTAAGYIPTDDKNVAIQAAKLFKAHFGIAQGVHIFLDKRIPVAAGLAGGSSDAAATLRGLNRLWHVGASPEALEQLGAQIGSDVPFCVSGGTALATGRGEVLQRLPMPPHAYVVLCKPAVHVSTADIYKKLRIADITHRPHTAQLVQALHARDYGLMCQSLGNVLEPITMEMHPEVQTIQETMTRLGAEAVRMSGSGPTVYGIFQREAKASKTVTLLKNHWKDVYLVHWLNP